MNTINFLGYNNLTFLSLGFDMENNKFVAVSNGKTVHAYQGGSEYARITHYDKKGNVKGTYSIYANQTADSVAAKLNEASFVQGDYLKLYHLEQSGRLRISGYIQNFDGNISRGVGNLNLNTSYFYINGENLEYSNVQLDLSANKDDLSLKIEEAKKIKSEGYTKTSYESLQNAIKAGEDVIASTNVYEEEVNLAVEAIDNAISGLRGVNVINFLGYNNLTFLSLSFDMENNKFVAVSNGKKVHDYQGSSVYATITHYNSNGEVKGTYSVRANETADNIAAKLNEASFEQGDYLKLYHLEQGGRLRISGYIQNFDADISRGVGNLNLNTSYFYINGENLEYFNA